MKIIYDGDPGIDDAIAILAAALTKEHKLVAVTTVAGNAPIEYATKNALKIMELLPEEMRTPVYEGSPKPMRRSLTFNFKMHGSDGLGNSGLSEPKLKQETTKAVEKILQMIDKYGRELTLVAAGPLTNLALAILKDRELAGKIGRVVVMGGAIRAPGNITSSSEFNIYVDPEAAKIVLNSGLPITLVSLDVTTDPRNLFTERELTALAESGSRIAEVAYKMLKFYINAYKQNRGINGCFIHDTLAMLIATQRELMIKSEDIYVDVETRGEVTLGRTQADLRALSKSKPNVVHPVEIDYLKTKEMLIGLLKTEL